MGEFETIFGVKLAQKPEYMTHLRGNLLVFKDHPRIALRGKIDSLEAAIILLQLKAQEKGDLAFAVYEYKITTYFSLKFYLALSAVLLLLAAGITVLMKRLSH